MSRDGLTSEIAKAMKACAKKGERKACDECPLQMHCSAPR